MSRFDWNKELINNTIENEIKKQTLMHEMNNQRDEAMHSIYDMEFTKEQFRNLFRSELTKLSKISEPMTEFTFDLYSKVNPSELFIPVFEEQHISIIH